MFVTATPAAAADGPASPPRDQQLQDQQATSSASTPEIREDATHHRRLVTSRRRPTRSPFVLHAFGFCRVSKIYDTVNRLVRFVYYIYLLILLLLFFFFYTIELCNIFVRYLLFFCSVYIVIMQYMAIHGSTAVVNIEKIKPYWKTCPGLAPKSYYYVMRCNRLINRLRLKLQLLLYAFQPSRLNLNSLFCHVNMFVAKMNYGLIILVINVNLAMQSRQLI